MCTGKGNVFMAEKRIIRFEKWILKVVISYAVFIGIGWLLGRIPAEKNWPFRGYVFRSADVFMLFGPIYLTLIVKIVLTILAVIKHKEKDTAEQNRGTCKMKVDTYKSVGVYFFRGKMKKRKRR